MLFLIMFSFTVLMVNFQNYNGPVFFIIFQDLISFFCQNLLLHDTHDKDKNDENKNDNDDNDEKVAETQKVTMFYLL
jgi:L-lactate permease